MSLWTPETRQHSADLLLRAAPVLPVIRIDRLDDALPLAEALLGGGLPVLEITLRSPVALAAIERIASRLPEARVGAGTVLEPTQLRDAEAAGAGFAISPGATPALYAAAEGLALPWLPAVATASEIMQGLAFGHRRFKFFPAASSGGPAALRALAGPFPQVGFCPTGGIDAASAADWLALPNVLTVGGSWMLPAAAVAAGDWPAIRRLAAAAAALAARPPIR